jgi:hypothetical protein
MTSKRSVKDRAVEQADYAAWKILAGADLLGRHDVKPGTIPERLWRRLFIEGMTPQEAGPTSSRVRCAQPSSGFSARSADAMGGAPHLRREHLAWLQAAAKTGAAERERCAAIVERWNAAPTHDWSPAVGTALKAGYRWLDVYCGGCREVKPIDLAAITGGSQRLERAICATRL